MVYEAQNRSLLKEKVAEFINSDLLRSAEVGCLQGADVGVECGGCMAV